MADPAATTDGGVPFLLDGREVVGRPGEVIISAAERAGTYIPRFCYHPRMEPVGMCRMCLVEVAGPRGASLQPACFVAVAPGMEVTTESAKVKKAQDGVLELLLVNHPLDCPVCDKGGECPLQDQTLAYGPGESRFVEEKRHFEKPIAISDLVLLDRERCIQCARCTRFADEIAGEAQIDFAGRGERVEVATFPDQPFSSYFSGNTVQICPVGALTATPYRFSARPWDLDQVESTCTTCSVGCRVAVQSSANRLTRLVGLDADPVNQGWLCDKGRFGFESANSEGRLTEPMVRKEGELVAVSWGEALVAAAEAVRSARAAGGPGAVAMLGGARTTDEGAYAWVKLAKGVIGTDSVDAQLGDGLPAELVLSLPRATIDEMASARVVLLMSGDLREELPVLFLRLRAAALGGSTALVEISPLPTSLTSLAAVSLRARPGDTPALVDVLTGAAAALAPHPEGDAVSATELSAARELLGDGHGVVVVIGRGSVAEDPGLAASAAAKLAAAFPAATFLPALRRGNVMGALELGMAPGLLPGRVSLEAGRHWFTRAWGQVPEGRGLDALGVLSDLAGEGGTIRTLFLIGTDLTDFPDRDLAQRALEAAASVICVAGHHDAVPAQATVVLPVAIEHERAGTTTNLEGRLSRLAQKLIPPGEAWTDWTIAAELAAELGAELGSGEIWDEIDDLSPAYGGVSRQQLDAARDGILPWRTDHGQGTVVPVDPMAFPGVESVELVGAGSWVGFSESSVAAVATELPAGSAVRPPSGAGLSDAAASSVMVPHVSPPDSYSLRLVAPRKLYDDGALVADSPSLVVLVDTPTARVNSYDLDRLGAGTGDRVTLRSARGSRTVDVVADDGVPRGVVALAFNLDGAATALIDAGAVVTEVRMESVR